MRRVLVAACLTLLMLSLGCKLFDSSPSSVDHGPKWVAGPNADKLVGYLNRNAQDLNSIYAEKAFIKAKQNGEGMDLEALIACQKAARPGTAPGFRLMGTVLGNTEVDVGSNGDEFWYWIKHAPYPYVYHCAHADYKKVAARGGPMPFPFQPEWVVEALGMAEYDPKANYEVRESKTTYDLIQRIGTARGDEVVKVVAFHKTERPGKSQVAGYILYKPTGNAKAPYEKLCAAAIEDSQVVAVGDGRSVAVPNRVRLECPREKMELTVEMGKTRVNAGFGDSRPDLLFSRRSLNNYKSYDLAKGGLDAPADDVRQAGGYRK